MSYDPDDPNNWDDDEEKESARSVIYMLVMTALVSLIVWALAIKELKDIFTGQTEWGTPLWVERIISLFT